MLLQDATKLSPWQTWIPKRGEIYLVDLGEDTIDCEQRGTRPVVVLSNNIANQHSSIVTIAPLTTRCKLLPVHVLVGQESGIKFNSYILTEHIKSISKRRFFTKGNPIYVGKLPAHKLIELESATKIQLGLTS